ILSILILKGLFNQEFGAVNTLLKGIFGFAPEWETNPWGARAMVLLVNLWLGYPYMMLICTGMLQSIPGAIYEASSIDRNNVLFWCLALASVSGCFIVVSCSLLSLFLYTFPTWFSLLAVRLTICARIFGVISVCSLLRGGIGRGTVSLLTSSVSLALQEPCRT